MAPAMEGAWQAMGRWLFVIGLIIAGIGAALMAGVPFSWFGRLPGDLLIRRDHVSISMPFTTCLVLSLLVSVILWLVGRFRP